MQLPAVITSLEDTVDFCVDDLLRAAPIWAIDQLYQTSKATATILVLARGQSAQQMRICVGSLSNI